MTEKEPNMPPDLIDHDNDMANFVLDIILGVEDNTAPNAVDMQQMGSEDVKPMQRGRLSTLKEGSEYDTKSVECKSTDSNDAGTMHRNYSDTNVGTIGRSKKVITNSNYLRQISSQVTYNRKPSIEPTPQAFHRSVSVNDAKLARSVQNILPFSTMMGNQTVDANVMADLLGVGPKYRQQEKERWTSAAQLYQEMLSQCNTPDHGSPPDSRNSLTNVATSGPINIERKLKPEILTPANTPNMRDFSTYPLHTHVPSPKGGTDLSDDFLTSPTYHITYLPHSGNPSQHNINMLGQPESSRLPSGILTPNQVLSGACRSTMGSASESRAEFSNSLELEAIAAVHELSFAVDQIAVSEMLPRTRELIFVNVTTVEGKPYCMELTFKGWRVCSTRHDCMLGDWQQVTLHAQYFDTIYSLMDEISPQYRQRFGERLAQRLRQLQTDSGGSGTVAPSSSYHYQSAPDNDQNQNYNRTNMKESYALKESNSGPNFTALPCKDAEKLESYLDPFPMVTISVRHPSDTINTNNDQDNEDKVFTMDEQTES